MAAIATTNTRAATLTGSSGGPAPEDALETINTVHWRLLLCAQAVNWCSNSSNSSPA